MADTLPMTHATILPTEQVPFDVFRQHIADARAASFTIRDATCPADEYPRWDTAYYLTRDRLSGYGITNDGHLIGLFSLVRGRGASLVAAAIDDGTRTLDCFDGFLTGFYGRHGFVETDRQLNWAEGEPDVVFMELLDS